MALTKFAIAPNQAGYSVTDGQETISQKLDGGKGRYRLDVLNSSRAVNVRWNFNESEYLYFRAFYNTITVSGSLPFLIDLVIDSSALTEHEAHFVTKSVSLSQTIAGKQFTVGAQLEIKPDIPDAEYDETIVMLVDEYGSLEVAQEVLEQLEQLVNVDMPGSLPG